MLCVTTTSTAFLFSMRVGHCHTCSEDSDFLVDTFLLLAAFFSAWANGVYIVLLYLWSVHKSSSTGSCWHGPGPENWSITRVSFSHSWGWGGGWPSPAAAGVTAEPSDKSGEFLLGWMSCPVPKVSEHFSNGVYRLLLNSMLRPHLPLGHVGWLMERANSLVVF